MVGVFYDLLIVSVSMTLPETSPGAVLGDDADAARLDAGAHERIQVVVAKISEDLKFRKAFAYFAFCRESNR